MRRIQRSNASGSGPDAEAAATRHQPGNKATPHFHPDSVMGTLRSFQRRLVANSQQVDSELNAGERDGWTLKTIRVETSVAPPHTSSS
ncbi:MAG: hypothetical protein ACOYD0_02560 [Candidatus Nanopelagicales bacterium]